MNNKLLLQLDNLHFSRRGDSVLEKISFSVSSNEIVTLIGPNGSGKSTVVRLVTGLLQPTGGLITRKPGLTIGYMPQFNRFDLSLPLKVKGYLNLASRNAASIQSSLELLSIEHLLHKPVQGLSGGELQRVIMARAILKRPQLLVLDEPVQGVDVKGQAELYRLIAQLRDNLGVGVLMVSHDLHMVMASTDTVICLNQHICCQGKPESVSQHPEYLELFGKELESDIAIYTHHHDHHHDIHGDVVTTTAASDKS